MSIFSLVHPASVHCEQLVPPGSFRSFPMRLLPIVLWLDTSSVALYDLSEYLHCLCTQCSTHEFPRFPHISINDDMSTLPNSAVLKYSLFPWSGIPKYIQTSQCGNHYKRHCVWSCTLFPLTKQLSRNMSVMKYMNKKSMLIQV